jgi:hypothetical protein
VIGYGERRTVATALQHEERAQQIAAEWTGQTRHQLIARSVTVAVTEDVDIEPLGDAI